MFPFLDPNDNRRYSMIRRRTFVVFLATVTALLVCGSAVVVNTRAFQVRDHGWQMERAGQQRYSKPLPSTGDGLVAYAW